LEAKAWLTVEEGSLSFVDPAVAATQAQGHYSAKEAEAEYSAAETRPIEC
jgi:hypothetical protein